MLDRLGEFAQFEKLQALALLQQKLLDVNLSSSQYDFPQRVLDFLYHASRGAIASEYSPSFVTEKLVDEAQNAGKKLISFGAQ